MDCLFVEFEELFTLDGQLYLLLDKLHCNKNRDTCIQRK